MTQAVRIGDGSSTYVSQFRKQFPWLAEGKTGQQILSDGEADCSDMAAAGKLTTRDGATLRPGQLDSRQVHPVRHCPPGNVHPLRSPLKPLSQALVTAATSDNL